MVPAAAKAAISLFVDDALPSPVLSDNAVAASAAETRTGTIGRLHPASWISSMRTTTSTTRNLVQHLTRLRTAPPSRLGFF